MDGIINVYKEKGFTSHDVVAIIRKLAGQKKVGHTGTLDPEAEGVLPVCLGKATKLADYIMTGKKAYHAELTLGVTTTTQDHTGERLETKEVLFDEERIKKIVASFQGEYDQIPPMYSAIKVKGKKLYELARQGKEIERKPRRIQIDQIEVTRFLPPNRLELDVVCSKGTYIRTLCADIGDKMGCGGHMSSLLRTETGNFKAEDSFSLAELKKLAEKGQLQNALLPMEEALKEYKTVFISSRQTQLLHNGGRIGELWFEKVSAPLLEGETVLVYDAETVFVGIYCVQKAKDGIQLEVKPVRILMQQEK